MSENGKLVLKFREENGWDPVIVCPFNTITVEETYCEPHPPLVDEDTWVYANINTLRELGPERYFRLLLRVLREGPVLAEVADADG